MSGIKELPGADLWSLQFLEGVPVIFNQPKVALALYGDRVECLLKEKVLDISPEEKVHQLLSDQKLGKRNDSHLIFHAFYELGAFWRGHLKDTSSLLGYWFEFQEREVADESLFSPSNGKFNVHWEQPSFDHYKEAFLKGRFHLKRGDCYQYNLTFPFYGEIKEGGIKDFMNCLWSSPQMRGEYAGLTRVKGDFFYSNSPECLFNIKEVENVFQLETKPIKGTVQLSGNDEKDWQELSQCSKNESELFMITDLLRNDLNAIERPRVKVLKKKAPLKVPGLLHSYSHLLIELSSSVTMEAIMKSLFPGGSITGAPKKRVMEIIESLESQKRGFYCGSTLVRSENLFRASINIRGGHIKKDKISYHAGSGITFESTLEGEFEEMLAKHKSVADLMIK